MKGQSAGVRRVVLSLTAGMLAAATVSAGHGPAVTELYNTEGSFTIVEGMCRDGGTVYFGQSTDVLTLDLATLTVADVGDLPANSGVSLVQRVGGATCASYAFGFAYPYPYAFGELNGGGIFTNTWNENGIFDAAVNSQGEMYVVANPDPSNFSTNPPYIGTGAALYRYDPGTDTATPVAVMGGFTGGIAFDANDDLYYADQTVGQIWRYTAAQLAAGGLTAGDAQVVVNGVFAGYLVFDPFGYLYATTGYPASLHRYDVNSGALVRALTPAQMPDVKGSLGKLAWDPASMGLLTASTDWTAFAGYLYSLLPPYVGNDFDGDRLADVVVYHPAAGKWYIRRSSTGAGREQVWGWPTSVPAPGDYDGDSVTDIAAYDNSTGNWFVLGSGGGVSASTWGWNGAIPVPGDYDGDGLTDLAVYGPVTGTWYVLRSSDGTAWVQAWGWSGATPVPGDFDGDGSTDAAVYDSASGTWYVLRSSDGTAWVQAWGWSGADPVPADFDGDGLTDAAVYDRAGGMWYVLRSSDGTAWVQAWCWSEADAVNVGAE